MKTSGSLCKEGKGKNEIQEVEELLQLKKLEVQGKRQRDQQTNSLVKSHEVNSCRYMDRENELSGLAQWNDDAIRDPTFSLVEQTPPRNICWRRE